LGLSIVKAVIEQHNGIVQIQSGVGQGTTVIVRLPSDTG
jgi:signal transduction histidine kinase